MQMMLVVISMASVSPSATASPNAMFVVVNSPLVRIEGGQPLGACDQHAVVREGG